MSDVPPNTTPWITQDSPTISRIDRTLLATLDQVRKFTHSSSSEEVEEGMKLCEEELDELRLRYSYISTRPWYQTGIRLALAYACHRIGDDGQACKELAFVHPLVEKIKSENTVVGDRWEKRYEVMFKLCNRDQEEEEEQEEKKIDEGGRRELENLKDSQESNTRESPLITSENVDIAETPAATLSRSLGVDSTSTPATLVRPNETATTLVRPAEGTPSVTPGNRSPSGGQYLPYEGEGPSKQRLRLESPDRFSGNLGRPEVDASDDESGANTIDEGSAAVYRRLPEESPSPPPVLEVSVRVKATLAPDETLYLVGDHQSVGAWTVQNGVKLTVDDEGTYSGSFRLAGRIRKNLIEVKLVKTDSTDELTWELKGKKNRTIDVGDAAEEEVSFEWED